MAKELTFTFYLKGKQVPVGRLPDEYLDEMADRLGRVMSTYYTAHPEQYLRLIKAEGGHGNGAARSD